MSNEIFNSVLFHGTSSEINTFNFEQLGSKKGTGFPLGHLGIYLTPCPSLASMFCKYKWTSPHSKYKSGSNVIPVTVTPKKTKYMSAFEWIATSASTRETINLRNTLISHGYDTVVVESSDFVCCNELYVPQVIVLNPDIIQFKLSDNKG